MPFESLPEMFFTHARRFAGRPRYRFKRSGRWREVTWEECAERVSALTAALIDLGVQPGDRVGLLSATRAEWMETDLAILSAGAITVPVYPSVLADECGYVLWNAGATVVVAENEQQADKVGQVREHGFELEGKRVAVEVKRVLRIEGTGENHFDAWLEKGRGLLPALRGEIESRIAAQKRDQLATIVYTSGTTGPPKGVMQTHGNHLASVESIRNLGVVEPGDIDFFFLPLAHSFARTIEYVGLYLGTITVYAQSIDTLLDDVRESQPTVIPSVPRIYEKIYTRIHSGRDQAPPLKRALMDWAFRVGRARSRAEQERRPLSWWLAWQAKVADRLVFSKIRDVLGGRLKHAVSGGAPLAKEIAEFMHAVGILVLEGYGLTETTPILSCNRPDAFKFGTVGRPIDNVTLRFASDGEILAKGPNIAIGYYRRPEATAEAWDEEGWFHTGDIGDLDEDGFLRITDRKKDLIKTSGGKYVAPQAVENLLKTQPHISQAVVVGDNRKYCVALISADVEEVGAWAEARGLSLPEPAEWGRNPEVVGLIEKEVAEVNRQLPSYETIKYFRLFPHDLTQDGGELTPSLKVKRKVVMTRYVGLIDEMYD
jgi:long-chain acyl-CoA synthetase